MHNNNNKTILDGGSLQLTGNNVTYAQGWTLTDNADNRIGVTTGITATLSGKLTGTNSGFTKSSDGILILSSGTNDYTGATTITAGTLKLTGSGSIADSKQFPPVNLEDPEKNRVFLIETNAGLIGGAPIILVGGTEIPFEPGTLPGNMDIFLDASQDKTKTDETHETLWVDLGLVWNKPTNAHGTLNVTDSFTLNVGLENNTIVINDGSKGQGPGGAYDSSDPDPRKWTWNSQSLTKTGAGALVLTGENLYTGGATVKSGILQIGGRSDKDTTTLKTNVTVASGSTLGGHGKTLGASVEAACWRVSSPNEKLTAEPYAALLGLSVGMKITKNSNLRLQYQGELGSRGQNHEGQLVLEVRW